MSTKQWLQVDVGNEVVMHFLLSLISSLDFKPLSVPIEANSGSVYRLLALVEDKYLFSFRSVERQNFEVVLQIDRFNVMFKRSIAIE